MGALTGLHDLVIGLVDTTLDRLVETLGIFPEARRHRRQRKGRRGALRGLATRTLQLVYQDGMHELARGGIGPPR